jgi:hypothetical protein
MLAFSLDYAFGHQIVDISADRGRIYVYRVGNFVYRRSAVVLTQTLVEYVQNLIYRFFESVLAYIF